MNYFRLSSLFFSGLLMVSPFSYAVELMKWERIPLQVPLHVEQERLVFVDKNVRVGLPASLNGKLRVQSSGGVVYLQEVEAFPLTRLQLQNVENGELILLDISAKTGNLALEPIKLVYQGDVTNTTSRQSTKADSDQQSKPVNVLSQTSKTPLSVLLTRYAAQSLYAPVRTLELLPGIHPLSASLPVSITTLLPSEHVSVTPLAAWGLSDYSVVALKLKNQSQRRIELDARRLSGRFYSATFQHHWLGISDTPEDTTTLYLVIKGRPDSAFIPEPIKPLVKEKKATTKAKRKERNNAD